MCCSFVPTTIFRQGFRRYPVPPDRAWLDEFSDFDHLALAFCGDAQETEHTDESQRGGARYVLQGG
jgi:hypothetical protein